MSIEFKLPEISDGVEAADIAEVLIAEGDSVESGQIVFEVETEKAVVEIECPHAGRVGKVHVAQGDTIPIGAPLLTIEDSDGAPAKSAPADAADEDQVEPESLPDNSVDSSGDSESAGKSSKKSAREEATSDQTRDSQPAGKAATVSDVSGESSHEPPPPAGPATRRLARELGVDLRQVVGSGDGGRITAEDVQAFVRKLTSGAATMASGATAPALPDFSQFGTVERVRLNKIAKTSAAGLSTSWQVIPHVTQHDLADITELEAARKQFSQSRNPSDPKVTMTAVMIKAAAVLLQEFPKFNSSIDIDAGELIVKQYYNIGVAVDTPNGLLVPVVRGADQKSIVEIADELTDLAARARDKKLDLKEMQGATFTITNLGGIGGTAFTPIVNFPEVAILGMSRSQKVVQLVDGHPVERLMLPLSLSYDHRVVNGADAARFVVRLSQILADSFQLLIRV